MRPKLKRADMPADLVMAIGLVWGHLAARQFEEAYLLAKGCMRVWPDDRNLILMHAYAAAEVLEPVDTGKLLAVRDAACEEWIQLVLRRMAPGFATPPIELENAPAATAKPGGKVATTAPTAVRASTSPPPPPPPPPARQGATVQGNTP
jgi:hypothetical protein